MRKRTGPPLRHVLQQLRKLGDVVAWEIGLVRKDATFIESDVADEVEDDAQGPDRTFVLSPAGCEGFESSRIKSGVCAL